MNMDKYENQKTSHEQNTKVVYLYRDAANYKIHCEEIICGSISKEQEKELFDRYVKEEFYPASIGFSAPTFVTLGYRPYSDDPDFHELIGLEPTDREATVPLSTEEFMGAIKSGRAFTRDSSDG